jgi:hypothetical protein
MREEVTREPLDKEVQQIIEEARMVLPGIQALFGFQLIAVFNPEFKHLLGPTGREVHLMALILVALAIALIMAPAAFHRQAARDRVSKSFADYASTLITVAMIPLMVAISSEVGIVTFVISESTVLGVGVSAALLGVFGILWFVIPRWAIARGRVDKATRSD